MFTQRYLAAKLKETLRTYNKYVFYDNSDYTQKISVYDKNPRHESNKTKKSKNIFEFWRKVTIKTVTYSHVFSIHFFKDESSENYGITVTINERFSYENYTEFINRFSRFFPESQFKNLIIKSIFDIPERDEVKRFLINKDGSELELSYGEYR